VVIRAQMILARLHGALGLALAMLVPAAVAAADGYGAGCRLSAAVRSTRPNVEEPALRVGVGIFILDVTQIDEVAEAFTVDFLLVVRWRDPRLSAAARGHSLESCFFQLADLWNPRIGIVNQRRVSSRGDERIRIDPDGNVEFRVGHYGDLSARLDLRRFPFDSQRLGISVASDYPPDEVELVGDPETTGLLTGAGLSGWRITRVDEAPVARPIEAAGAIYGVTEFSLWIDRDPGYYVWKVFLPLSLIVGMAGIVFWLDPKDYGPQIGISTASVFTLIAFLVSLGRFLPRVSYLTAADLFVLGSVLLVFSGLAECVLTSRLAQTGRHDLARRIDGVARWVYPAGYAGLVFALIAIA
jgi:Neurotransmitter-gated ion-channel ligand binding domain/Neurotransmitter-gated ion-channel transmembrane region